MWVSMNDFSTYYPVNVTTYSVQILLNASFVPDTVYNVSLWAITVWGPMIEDVVMTNVGANTGCLLVGLLVPAVTLLYTIVFSYTTMAISFQFENICISSTVVNQLADEQFERDHERRE